MMAATWHIYELDSSRLDDFLTEAPQTVRDVGLHVAYRNDLVAIPCP
jgi:hypothetical protein